VKRRVIWLFVCMVVLFGGLAVATEDARFARLDPALRTWVLEQAESESVLSPQSLLGDTRHYEISIPLEPGEEERISVLVKLNRAFFGTTLFGLPVEWSTGSILGFSATLSDILRLIPDDDVVYIEPAWKTEPTLDQSVPAIGADVVHSELPGDLGKDVIVATVDTGIDYAHLDFRYDSDGDGFEESSRILAILDQTAGLFDTEYSRTQIESDLANGFGPSEGLVRQADTDGHGTHVMSIAAGDGSSSVEGFVGVAPQAWLVAVKTTFFTSDIIQAVDYIFDLADALGMPAVVNLSLGGHEGPHDGTSLFEEGLDQLTQGSGHIIVVSAGNEGDQAIHTSGTLLGGYTTVIVDPNDWETELSIWYPGGSQFTVAVTPPSGSPLIVPYGVDSGIIHTASGSVRIDNASLGQNPNNGDNEAFIRLSDLAAGADWEIMIGDDGGGGRFDMWITAGDAAIAGGDSMMTIDEPGNADRVITVGSYNTKATWPSLSGTQDYTGVYPLGALSEFSSRGPTRDGRTKPDICAPGAWICAALSENGLWQSYLVHPDGVHTMELGTSMASPHVSGTVAIMLSLDPSLTSSEIQQILRSTARQDAYTGWVPNQQWGWGKLDATAAVDAIEIEEPVEPPPTTAEPEIDVEENPVSTMAVFLFSLPEGTTAAWLRVSSVVGALVYEVELDPATTEHTWTLETDLGEALASGLYLYVLVTDRGVSEVGKLVIAR